MRKTFTRLCLGLALLQVVSGCASTYKPLRPETLQYSYKEANLEDNLSLSYMYDVLSLRNNKKYVKRETKNALKIVAVKVENTSASRITVAQDCKFYLGDREIQPMEPFLIASMIKQPVPIYLLYSLLNVTVGGTQDPSTGKISGGSFIPTGPFIAGGNMLVAGSANTQLRKELTEKNIMTKTIDPGQTVYGILCLREPTSGPLKIKLTPKAKASAQ